MDGTGLWWYLSDNDQFTVLGNDSQFGAWFWNVWELMLRAGRGWGTPGFCNRSILKWGQSLWLTGYLPLGDPCRQNKRVALSSGRGDGVPSTGTYPPALSPTPCSCSDHRTRAFLSLKTLEIILSLNPLLDRKLGPRKVTCMPRVCQRQKAD